MTSATRALPPTKHADDGVADSVASHLSELGSLLFGSRPLFAASRLRRAAARGDLATLRHLIDGLGPADINTPGWLGYTPLHNVCEQGFSECAQLLLERGARPNVVDYESGRAASMNTTPLHFAAAGGHLECVRLLLKHGAAPNPKDVQDYTPLMMAVANGHAAVVRLLLDTGSVDPSAAVADEACLTPLHVAMASNFETIAQLLLDHGADVGARDARNRTPLQYAAKQVLLKSAIQLDADREAAMERRQAKSSSSECVDDGRLDTPSSGDDAAPDRHTNAELDRLLLAGGGDDAGNAPAQIDQTVDRLMEVDEDESSVESVESSINDSGDELVSFVYRDARQQRKNSGDSSDSSSSGPDTDEHDDGGDDDSDEEKQLDGGRKQLISLEKLGLTANSDDEDTEENDGENDELDDVPQIKIAQILIEEVEEEEEEEEEEDADDNDDDHVDDEEEDEEKK